MGWALGVGGVGSAVWGDEISDLVAPAPGEELSAEKLFMQGVLRMVGAEGAADAEAAVECWRKAAAAGYAPAQSAYSQCLMAGVGVEANMEEAVVWLRKAADQGDVVGLNGLGRAYSYGYGVAKDPAKGVEFLRAAAEKGYARAQHSLGLAYSHGRGVAKNYGEAVEWFRKGAQQGYTLSQHTLGEFYALGRGVKRDYAAAAEWYTKAAETGYPKSIFYLGTMTEKGRLGSADPAAATEYYKRAGRLGHEAAFARLAWLVKEGYTDADGTEVQDPKEALRISAIAAAMGSPHALNSLGVSYEKGESIRRNRKRAFELYVQAAELDPSVAAFNVGHCYHKGVGVEIDFSKALEWYIKAAESGHMSGMKNAFWFYMEGKGTPQNYREAVKWARKLSERGHPDACQYIGWMHEYGWLGKKDEAAAFRSYNRPMEVMMHPPSYYEVGRCYYQGVSVERDLQKALELWKRGADCNNSKAGNNLGVCAMRGEGLPQNDAQAVMWFTRGKDKNEANLYNLALCFEAGRGVKQNLREAVKRYLSVATCEHRLRVAEVALRRLGVKVSDSRGEDGYAFDISHPENALKAEDVPAMVRMVFDPDVPEQAGADDPDWRAMLPPDEPDGEPEPLPEVGELPAQRVASCLAQARDARARGDDAAAAELFSQAAELGDEQGRINRALCLYRGKGLPQDRAAAKRLLQKGFQLGDMWSYYVLHLLEMLEASPAQ